MSQQVAPAETPDLTGPHGRAWRVSHPDAARDHPASLESWLVNQPGAHPFWSWYMVGGVHLRPQAGADPPKLQCEGATHEFLVVALDPGKPLPMVKRWERAAYMTPIDLVHQVVLPSDEAAQEILDTIVAQAVKSGVALDEDNRGWWKGALDKTAEHYREGLH